MISALLAVLIEDYHCIPVSFIRSPSSRVFQIFRLTFTIETRDSIGVYHFRADGAGKDLLLRIALLEMMNGRADAF